MRSTDDDHAAAIVQTLTDAELVILHGALLALVPPGTRPENFHGRIDLEALAAVIREVDPSRNKTQADEEAELDADTYEVLLSHPTLSSVEAERVVRRARGLTATLTRPGPQARLETRRRGRKRHSKGGPNP